MLKDPASLWALLAKTRSTRPCQPSFFKNPFIHDFCGETWIEDHPCILEFRRFLPMPPGHKWPRSTICPTKATFGIFKVLMPLVSLSPPHVLPPKETKSPHSCHRGGQAFRRVQWGYGCTQYPPRKAVYIVYIYICTYESEMKAKRKWNESSE
jgi:hypothetical protein